MSAFGSSVINKSNKKLAPRAPPPRRRAAAVAETSSEQTQAPLPTPPVSQDVPQSPPIPTSADGTSTRQYEPIDTSQELAHKTPPRKRRRVGDSDRYDESATLPSLLDVLRNPETATPSEPSGPHRLTRSTHAHPPVSSPRNLADLNTPSNAPTATSRTTRSQRPSGASSSEVVASTNATAKKSATRVQTSQAKNKTNSTRQNPSTSSARTRKAKEPTVVDNGTEVQDSTSTTGQSKRKRNETINSSSTDAETGNDTQNQEDSPTKKARRRRKTPDGAENNEIDTTSTLMFDLTKDSKQGQKSRLEGEFQEIDWSEVVRLRKEAEARARDELLANAPTASQQPSTEQPTQTSQDEPQGPRLKLVNGQIVLDNSSLLVDRHAGAMPDTDQPAVEERDITRRITSSTWLHDNRRDPEERQLFSSKSDPWTPEATAKFYSALRMWGTDFFMISKMFPGRTRRHIKLKFVREERANPESIREALIGGSVPMDLEAYCEATGKSVDDYKDPEALQEELKVEEERQKQEIERQREEQAAAMRKKQEAAAAKAASGRGRKAADKTGGASGSKGRKRKQDTLDDGLISSVDVVESIEV